MRISTPMSKRNIFNDLVTMCKHHTYMAVKINDRETKHCGIVSQISTGEGYNVILTENDITICFSSEDYILCYDTKTENIIIEHLNSDAEVVLVPIPEEK